MEQQKIDMFIAQNANKFPPYKMGLIKDALSQLDDNKATTVLCIYAELRDPSEVLLLSVLLGFFGVDRFMLGEVGLGILKLLTCGGCYIWWIVDMVNAQERTREYN